eukprot:Clim_evm107s152 gene=Clim_evmTU107s152
MDPGVGNPFEIDDQPFKMSTGLENAVSGKIDDGSKTQSLGNSAADAARRERERNAFEETQRAMDEADSSAGFFGNGQQRETGRAPLVDHKKEPNFPRFPKKMFWPYKPLMYHDIEGEIPPQCQQMAKRMYFFWHWHVLGLSMNLIAALSRIGCNSCDSVVFSIIISIVFLVLFIPMSLIFWYRVIYNAFRTDRSLNFLLFFFVFGFQTLGYVINAIGLSFVGAIGWIEAINAYEEHEVVTAIFTTLSAVIWTLAAIGGAFMLVTIHNYYRYAGLSIDKAKQEAAAEGMTSAIKAQTGQRS